MKQTNLCYVLVTLCIILAFCDAGNSDGFVHTRDGKFILNEKSFSFNGFNANWMLFAASGVLARHNTAYVISVMEQASMNGLTVGRFWAFNDGGYLPLQITPGVYSVIGLWVSNRAYIHICIILNTTYVACV